MGLNDLIAKVTDPYDRPARLWPALLAVFPLIATVSLLYGPELSALSNVVMLGASCGGIFLMMNISREMGKRLEERLFHSWGGKPTTQLLRHSDKTIEGVTKQRYHQFLSTRLNVTFPGREEESANPVGADEVYQSAIRWLINQTRDIKKFALLFKENVTYGFRRNALGVKPIGMAACLVSIVTLLLRQKVVCINYGFCVELNSLETMTKDGVISLLASVVMLVIWICYFTKTSVRTAAFTYAETLLRACDDIERK